MLLVIAITRKDEDIYGVDFLCGDARYLDQVSEFGAIAAVTFPKPQGGSGFPARVVAIVP